MDKANHTTRNKIYQKPSEKKKTEPYPQSKMKKIQNNEGNYAMKLF